jgi:hemoglobin
LIQAAKDGVQEPDKETRMIRRLVAPMLLTLALGACAAPEKKSADASLYERLGGKPAIEKVVDQFVANVAADGRINKRFANTDIGKFKALLVDQICEATGGPCKYAGRDMATTHKGMKITKQEFNWTGGHLAAALDTYKVPEREKKELLTAIGSMEPQIVGQ